MRENDKKGLTILRDMIREWYSWQDVELVRIYLEDVMNEEFTAEIFEGDENE